MDTHTHIDIPLDDLGKLPTQKKVKKEKESTAYFILRSFFMTGGLIYGLICLMFIFFQNSLIYQPTTKIERVPMNVGHSFMNLLLNSKDDGKVNAWFVPAPKNLGTVLICRKNSGNMSEDLSLIDGWNRIGFNVMTFDYQGFGMSKGMTSEENCYADSRAAYDWLKSKGMTSKNFIIHGQSIGSSVASKLAMEVGCNGLILESAFTSLKDVANERFSFLPMSVICFNNFPTLKRVQNIRTPIMVMHSAENEKIPFSMARELYDAASEPRMFYTLRNDSSDASYLRALESFTNMVTPPEKLK